jgi:hypothetical protein
VTKARSAYENPIRIRCRAVLKLHRLDEDKDVWISALRLFGAKVAVPRRNVGDWNHQAFSSSSWQSSLDRRGMEGMAGMENEC